MHYLIDGYNLMFRLLESKKNLQSQRETVIRSLQKEFKCLHLHGTIVFDGRYFHGEQSGLSYHSPLTIAYSHSGESADQYIVEKLETASAPGEITVVTDDRFLAAAARSHGARTLQLNAFLVQIEKKHTKRRLKKQELLDERPFKESQREQQRLLKAFEERLIKKTSDDF
jgi:predicted RNA-binding protein with PIN domain